MLFIAPIASTKMHKNLAAARGPIAPNGPTLAARHRDYPAANRGWPLPLAAHTTVLHALASAQQTFETPVQAPIHLDRPTLGR